MKEPQNAFKLEKGRISALQLGFLAVTIVIATADIFLPAYVAQEAGEDSWISVIMATVSSFLIIMLFLTLGLRHPDKTIIQYSCDILGKPLGKLFGFFYIYYFFDIAFSVNRELGEIFVTAFNPDSPLVVYCIITVAVAAYAVYKGLEVIARVNQLILPAGIIILGLIALINIKATNLANFTPVLAKGFLPPLKGGILIQGWMMELIILLQLIPYVKDKNKIRKSISVSVLVLGLSMGIGVLTIAVFGKLTGELLFPALIYVRYAHIGEDIKNLDITIMGVWITGIFMKVAITYYAITLGISQLFGLKSRRYLIVPVGIVIISISVASGERINAIYDFGHYYEPLYSFTFAFILPSILLAVSLVKGKMAGKKPKNT